MIMTIYIPGSVQENYVITDPKVINYFIDQYNQLKKEHLEILNSIDQLENGIQQHSRQLDKIKKYLDDEGNLCSKKFFDFIFFLRKINHYYFH